MKVLSTTLLALFCYTLSAQTFTNYTTTDGLLNNNVSALCEGVSGEMWFGTQSGVSKFDGSTWTDYQQSTYPGMADDNILSIFMNSDDELWIGTDFGTSVYDGSAFTTYTSDDGLGNNKVQCIGEDGDGTMWFGTITGLSSYDGTSWTNYGTGDGLPFGGINSITLAANGDLWLGTGLGGIAIFDGTDFTEITEDDGLVSDKIRAVALAGDDKWVGTADGLSLLGADNSLKTNYTRIYTLPAPDTLNPIEDLAVGTDGVIWAGVYVDYLVTEGGVCAFNGNQWFEFDVEDGLVGPVVRALVVDASNTVWVATSSGISKISDHSLSSPAVSAQQFALYPNPANEYLNVQFLTDLSEVNHFDIYDASMKLVLQHPIAEHQTSTIVPLNGLQKGVYYIKIGQQVEQVLIAH